MRNEHEVLSQILQFAESDHRIRAVLQNGSRVNPNVVKDLFCDYDIVYVVQEPEYFLRDHSWIRFFGELIMMQQNTIRGVSVDWPIFLMLFTDGVRIDLSIKRWEDIDREDSLTVVLLDKDNTIQPFDPPSDKSYWISKPNKDEFEYTVNNILWCSTNAAKGLWRKQLPYAKYMQDVVVRDGMHKMLSWYIGLDHNWCINAGMAGKWFEKFLPEEIWAAYTRTYAGAEYEDIWKSLFEVLALTRRIGVEISRKLGYEYPMEDDERVVEYLGEIYFDRYCG